MLITSLYIIYKTKLVSNDMILVSSFFQLSSVPSPSFELILLPLLSFGKPSSDPWLAICKSFPTSILKPNNTTV